MADTDTGRQPSTEDATTNHIVLSGETLTTIAKNYARNQGMALNDFEAHDFALKIAELNGLNDPDSIGIGDLLRIPLRQADKDPIFVEGNPPSTSDSNIQSTPKFAQSVSDIHIRIGSIIHLENDAPDGGYLDILKKVEEQPLIAMYHDPTVQAFVATYHYASDDTRNERLNRSASWQILSADGAKQIGEPLAVGDKIHLLNMDPDAGYLDSFEWVDRMEPFKDYPMQIGVFTSGPKRGRDVSGTWTIQSGTDKTVGASVEAGDVIQLENAYPGAGRLHTYAKVAEHEWFAQEQYHGHRRFVFTGPKPATAINRGKEPGSPTWKITLNARTKNLYRVFHQFSEKQILLHDDIFEIGDRSMQRVTALKFEFRDKDQPLLGRVAYGREELPTENNFIATYRGQNTYDIHLAQGNKTVAEIDTANRIPDDQWQLGSREYQRVIAIDVESKDMGDLSGTITYEGEGPITIRLSREFTISHDTGTLFSGGHSPEWVRGRTNRIEIAIGKTYTQLADFVQEMSRCAIDDVLQQYRENTGDAEKTVALAALDYDFQIQQLLNLYTLSQALNAFFRYTLCALMKQSLEKHRANGDGSLAPLHLFRECFQRVARDHAILEQATTQRQWPVAANTIDVNAVELLKMDKLAIKAITPFRKLLVGDTNANEPLAVITYLSEKTHIHRVPYTKQFILIGVSYDRVPPAASIFEREAFLGKDFYAYEIMALPHEVGHYMYQYGKLDGQTFPALSKTFADNPYYRWCEEIFADVYSCIVAGPLAAISMQALLMSIDRDRAWKDDEDHPTPVLRVFIFAEILRILDELMPDRYNFKNGQNGFNVTDKLDQDWTRILQLWRYYDPTDNIADRTDDPKRPVRVYMYDNSTLHLNTIVNVDRVIMAIRPIIEEFATWLLNQAEFGDTDGQNTDKQKTGEQNSQDPLSMQIPWTDKNYTTTGPYNDVMAKMTDRDFAQKKVASQLIVNPNADEAHFDLTNPDEKLQQSLEGWDDSGPISGGGSGGTKGVLFQHFF